MSLTIPIIRHIIRHIKEHEMTYATTHDLLWRVKKIRNLPSYYTINWWRPLKKQWVYWETFVGNSETDVLQFAMNDRGQNYRIIDQRTAKKITQTGELPS